MLSPFQCAFEHGRLHAAGYPLSCKPDSPGYCGFWNTLCVGYLLHCHALCIIHYYISFLPFRQIFPQYLTHEPVFYGRGRVGTIFLSVTRTWDIVLYKLVWYLCVLHKNPFFIFFRCFLTIFLPTIYCGQIFGQTQFSKFLFNLWEIKRTVCAFYHCNLKKYVL